MSETDKAFGSRETRGNLVIVNEGTNKNEVSVEAQKKAEREEKIYQLKMRLNTANSKVTNSMNKLEPAVSKNMKKNEVQRNDLILSPRKSKCSLQDWKSNTMRYMK